MGCNNLNNDNKAGMNLCLNGIYYIVLLFVYIIMIIINECACNECIDMNTINVQRCTHTYIHGLNFQLQTVNSAENSPLTLQVIPFRIQSGCDVLIHFGPY